MIHEDRTRVQTLLGVNMVVEAGAGTGKTTLLIDRLCVSVLLQHTPVEKLVALTFTDKAAAEIKTRFIFKLQQLVQAVRTQGTDRTLDLLRTHFAVKEEELVARAEEALLRLDRASMGTIHSFCAEILKMFPLEAGLSPLAQIDSGYKAQQLFDVYWNQFLDGELGLQAARAADWKRVLAEISLDDLQAFARQLCAVKAVAYDYYSHRRLLVDQCSQKAARLRALYDFYVKPGKKPRNVEKALLWAADSLQRTISFLQSGSVPPAAADECPNLSLCKDWDEADFEEARGLIGFAQKVTPENQQLFLAAYHLVEPLAQRVRQAYREEGVLSFDDLIVKTRDLLQHNLYVRRVLKEKFDALFIDEFQDTDPIQGELLLFLAEEKSGTASRWQEVRLQPGKLFVVGDPKQSIYRFRGADITAYELFTDLILKQGGEKCFLQTNFRSQPAIIQLANQVCTRAMVQETAFQPAYVPIFTDKSTRTPAVEWLFVQPAPQGKPTADDFRHNQAEQIARWIEEQVGVFTLQDGRKLAYSDIALLTRAGTTSHIYTSALRRHGILFHTQADKDFLRKQEINDLILFLRAVADPEDKIALAGVLRSPYGGLTDEQLYQVAQSGFSREFLAHHPQTATCMAQLERFNRLAGRVSLPVLMETILQETFLPEACAAAYEKEDVLARLGQFVTWARAYEAQGGGSLLSFLTQLQTRVAENPESFGIFSGDESADAVSLLTVHKSKGLEFPVVILADVSRKETVSSAPPPAYLFSWQYNLYGLRVGKVCDVNLAFLEEEQKKHSRCEEIRILYVALTRAKEKLLLVGDGRCGAEKAAAAFVAAGVFPQGGDTVLSLEDIPLPVRYLAYQAPREFLYRQRAASLAAGHDMAGLDTWQAAYQARQQAYTSLGVGAQVAAAPSRLAASRLLTQEQEQGAELGTVCHRALELWLNGARHEVAAICAQAAQQAGAPSRAQEAAALVGPFVASPIFAQIANARLLACEMPFTVALNDFEVQSGVMDVVLQTAQGIWIVDYKTDRVSPGQEQALFDQKYRTQLSAYRQAAQQIFPGKNVRVSAVFVRTFAVIEG